MGSIELTTEQLKRENLQLRMQLAIAEARICQFVHDQCAAELKAMDDAKVTPIREVTQ